MPQYEFEVLERIEAGETAWEILDEALPTARKRFKRLTNALLKLMNDVQEHGIRRIQFASGQLPQ